jgi:hypothetical protein
MKKFFLIILTSVLLVNFTQAQGGRSTICVNAGFSLIGAIFNAASTHGGMPAAIQLTYDFAPIKWFSIGVAGSYQALKAGFSNVSLSGYSGTYSYEANYNRTNIGIRALFHYGPERVKMYSGLRFGTTMWSSSVSTGNVPAGYDPVNILKAGGKYAPQIIPFGLQGFITKNIGVNFEIGIGAPHYFSGGICVKI